MREHVAALGGRLLPEYRPTSGARVVAELPVPDEIAEGMERTILGILIFLLVSTSTLLAWQVCLLS